MTKTELYNQIVLLKKELLRQDKRMAELEAICEKKTTRLRVTAHAVVRYLDRILHIDVEGVRRSLKEEKIKLYTEELKKESPSIPVSDPELLKYLQENLGIDTDEIREVLLSNRLLKIYSNIGNSDIPDGDVIKVIRDDKIVTVFKNA